jgi:hypothetical protein
MTKKSFERHAEKKGHFISHKEYLAIINDPDVIYAKKTRRGPKVFFFGKRGKGDALSVVIVYTRKDTMTHQIATGYPMKPEKRKLYEKENELVFKKQEGNPQK